MRPTVLVAIVSAVVGGLAVYWLIRPSLVTPVRRTPIEVRDQSLPSAPPVGPRSSSMRAKIQEAVKAAPVHDIATLDQYLASLEARARAQRQVTALEVEPGLAMIRRFDSNLNKAEEFSARMLRLQREFDGSASRLAPDPRQARNTIIDMLPGIRQARSEPEKQLLIRKALDLVATLDPNDRDDVIRQIDATTGVVRQMVDASPP